MALLLFLASCYSVPDEPAKAIELTTGRVTVNGAGSLYYEERGDGEPTLLLLSGGASLDRRGWDGHFEAFAARQRTIRFDIRGMGESPAATEPFSPTEDVRAVLDDRGVDRAVLLGLSYGGSLAIDFAVEHPDRVAGLVLVAPGLSGFVPSAETIERLMGIFAYVEAGDLDGVVEAILSDPYLPPRESNAEGRARMRRIVSDNKEAFAADRTLPRMIDPPAIGRISSIDVPTLLIVGENDDPDAHRIVALLEREIAGARRVDIPNTAHVPQLDEPERFRAAVESFLADTFPR